MALSRRCEKYGPPVAMSRVKTEECQLGRRLHLKVGTHVVDKISGMRSVVGSSAERGDTWPDQGKRRRLSCQWC